MRILHTEASAGWGGQELRILSEMQGLRARGHILELAAPAAARVPGEAAALGFTVHDVPIGRKSFRGLLAVRQLLARESFDLVNTHSSTDAWLVALACATRATAPPIMRTRHISAPVPRNPASRWLFDVFALPSYANEGVPQALMQAMMTGLASVTCHVGAIDEIAIDGKTALIVPPQNTVALTAALQRLHDDIDLRARLGASARQFALEHCTFSAMGDAIEDVFRSIASRAA